MRTLLPFAASLLCMTATAQNDAQQHPADNLDRMPSNGTIGQVKMEDDNDPFKPNSFVGSFRMEVHMFKDGAEVAGEPMDMHYWSNPDMTLMSMAAPNTHGKPGTEMKMLTDLKGKWNYLLMTDPKGNKTAMKSRKQKYTFDAPGKDPKHGDFTVTKETKMIDGHKCTKVVGKMEDGTWTGWVAKDIAVPFADIASTMSRSAVQRDRQNWEGLTGFPLEYNVTDKDGKKVSEVFVKDLQSGEVDPSVFSITDYKIMEIPGIQRPEGK